MRFDPRLADGHDAAERGAFFVWARLRWRVWKRSAAALVLKAFMWRRLCSSRQSDRTPRISFALETVWRPCWLCRCGGGFVSVIKVLL